MPNWWDDNPDERYWCEITDRPDVGSDLKCPKHDEKGNPYWSYDMIRSVVAGDIVFHYSTNTSSVVGASVAGAPLESRPIAWVPHGTSGRGSVENTPARPGWWLPLHSYVEAKEPLTLAELRSTENERWIAEWRDAVRTRGAPAMPFQIQERGLRAAQGYLTKMPRAFVDRWQALTRLAEALESTQEQLDAVRVPTASGEDPKPRGVFAPKSEADYVATIRPTEQRRTRRHERLVREAGEWIKLHGGTVATSFHPIDLLLEGSREIVIEAKIVKQGRPIFAVRDAVGQLYEYEYFLKRSPGAQLCILLDEDPGEALVTYVEAHRNMLIAWYLAGSLRAGPRTIRQFELAGVVF